MNESITVIPAYFNIYSHKVRLSSSIDFWFFGVFLFSFTG
jgi:hypothetical protein